MEVRDPTHRQHHACKSSAQAPRKASKEEQRPQRHEQPTSTNNPCHSEQGRRPGEEPAVDFAEARDGPDPRKTGKGTSSTRADQDQKKEPVFSPEAPQLCHPERSMTPTKWKSCAVEGSLSAVAIAGLTRDFNDQPSPTQAAAINSTHVDGHSCPPPLTLLLTLICHPEEVESHAKRATPDEGPMHCLRQRSRKASGRSSAPSATNNPPPPTTLVIPNRAEGPARNLLFGFEIGASAHPHGKPRTDVRN
jgi:hypothetical protein